MSQPVYLTNHRKSPLVIPEAAREATSAVVALIKHNGPSPSRSAALEAFNVRLRRLTDPDSAVIIEELASHAAVLTALVERWATESIQAPTTESKVRFGKLALQAQNSCLRTLLAVKALQGVKPTVTVLPGGECE